MMSLASSQARWFHRVFRRGDIWQQTWDARLMALEKLFGRSDPVVFKADVPFRNHNAGISLCIEITDDELDECLSQRSTVVLERLRNSGVFPFTDLERESFSGGAA
jgi:hypothetical protein